MLILAIYLLFFLLIGVVDFFKVKNFDDYIVAGRKQKGNLVAMSILATTIGASATMGIADLASRYGLVAYLWLGSGGVALILQSFILSEKVRATNAHTLPGLAEVTAGKEGKIITALVIIIAWTGIIAAQFIALSSIVALLLGKESTAALMIICSIVVILYTAFGGQFSIIRTDAIQLLFVAGGIAVTLYSALNKTGINFSSIIYYKGESTVSLIKILHIIFIMGGPFFIGPDIFSRNFTAKSPESAKKATFKAGIGLLIFSAAITAIGISAKILNPTLAENPFIYIIKYLSNPVAGTIICFGLLSAIISSTDTCIITVAAIVEKDIIGKERLYSARIIVILFGILSLLLALFRKDILSLLSGTYSVFVPGVMFPMFFAIIAKGKKHIYKLLWLSAVIAGGLLGIVSNITGEEYFSLLGMLISAGLSAASIAVIRPVK